MQHHVGNAAVVVGQHRALKGLLVDEGHGPALQVVQAVHVGGVLAQGDLMLGGVDDHHGLEQGAPAVLDVLPQGVQVGGEDDRGGEQALLVLALALAEELLPPLVHHGVAGLVADHDLGALALVVEDVPDGGVLVAVVLLDVLAAVGVHGLAGAGHQGVDVRPGHGDGQQAHGGEHGEAAAHVVGHHEGLVALFVRQLLQSALGLVGGAEDALPGPLLAVLLLQQLPEDPEGDGGLGGGAGLGDHVDGDVLPLADLHQLLQGGGADAVPGEVDGRGVLAQVVVLFRLQKLNGSPGPQIRPADADDHEHVGIALDLLGRGLDPGELLLVIVLGQGGPPQEIAARALSGLEQLVGGAHLALDLLVLVVVHKALQISVFQFQRHNLRPPVFWAEQESWGNLPALRSPVSSLCFYSTIVRRNLQVCIDSREKKFPPGGFPLPATG